MFRDGVRGLGQWEAALPTNVLKTLSEWSPYLVPQFVQNVPPLGGGCCVCLLVACVLYAKKKQKCHEGDHNTDPTHENWATVWVFMRLQLQLHNNKKEDMGHTWD